MKKFKAFIAKQAQRTKSGNWQGAPVRGWTGTTGHGSWGETVLTSTSVKNEKITDKAIPDKKHCYYTPAPPGWRRQCWAAEAASFSVYTFTHTHVCTCAWGRKRKNDRKRHTHTQSRRQLHTFPLPTTEHGQYCCSGAKATCFSQKWKRQKCCLEIFCLSAKRTRKAKGCR